MFMRLVRLTIKVPAQATLRELFEERIIPQVRKIKGCRWIILLQNQKQTEEVVSVTLWQTKKDAENYDSSEIFAGILEEIRERDIIDSTEWKIQLSEDQQLEYVPVKQDPEVSHFTVFERKDVKEIHAGGESRIKATLYTRIVTQKIETGQTDNFRKIYSEEILPALEATPGCLSVFLLGNIHDKREIVSLTVWESRKVAVDYEKSGLFIELVNRVKSTYPQLMQWKLTRS